ncbi:MAG: hypothetical protein R3E01_22875 [Pirellulaceae bacterium]|nr:hypothetical protein [Planctomycetales bacterium]
MMTSRLALTCGLLAIVGFCDGAWSSSAKGAERVWSGAADNDFYNGANWGGTAPGQFDSVLIDGGANLPATIGATAGNRELDGFILGSAGATGGHIVQNGGVLNVTAITEAYVGREGSLDSSYIMNGDAVMNFDDPILSGGAGFGTDGTNGRDLEIGARSGANGSLGTFEMHGNAILRISDDLKIGAEGGGNGKFVIDGNAQAFVGSGVAVSESGDSKGEFLAAGNSLVVVGNSSAAGDADGGRTNEGYFTLSTSGISADVKIQDSAKVYVRTLQQRGGLTNFTIEDQGEFHVFDVYNFAAPNLGTATVVRNQFGFNSERTSHLAQSESAQVNLTLRDDAVFTVDSDLGDTEYSGLALAGGNNSGGITATGGKVLIDVYDRARFEIQQDLSMTIAASETPIGAESTLKIHGPDATVKINGDLIMSYDPIFATANGDPSTLYAVITDSTHSTIQVGGDAHIEFGNLAVELDGYAPVGGESYTLLTAGSVTGSAFRDTDLSLAPLRDGLSWDLKITGTAVTLDVLGQLQQLLGDYNMNGTVDAADYTIWKDSFGSTSDLAADGNGNGTIDAADYTIWKDNFGATAGVAASVNAVPEPASMTLCLMLLLAGRGLFQRRK